MVKVCEFTEEVGKLHLEKPGLIREIAMRMYGVPYRWAGATPVGGLDCSGFIVELFKSVGLLKNSEDLSSAALSERYSTRVSYQSYQLGDLAFYGKGKVSHVAFFIDYRHVIEAAGGDSSCLTREDAINQQAFVRIRPHNYRSDLMFVTRPLYF